MSYRRWVINQKISRRRQLARDKIFCRAERVINHNLTEEKKLADFPVIANYLSSKFPDVDLSPIRLYIALPRVIERAGWKDIGGCYIRGMKVIIVKSEIQHHYKAKGKFHRMMRDVCNMKADVEDIMVHEFIHAISDIIDRSLSRYQHMEEEFVYTNCIDFYYQKGMTDDDIVNSNFLPFCLQDVYESTKEMSSIFAKMDRTTDDVRQMSEEEYLRFLNMKAEMIIPLIRNLAQQKAHRMIELYHKYGAQMYKTSSAQPMGDETTMRFSSLDLE